MEFCSAPSLQISWLHGYSQVVDLTINGGCHKSYMMWGCSVVNVRQLRMALAAGSRVRAPCQLCLPRSSGLSRLIYHRHHSSRSDRALGGVFFCASCKKPHLADMGGRLRVCVSASALHEFWNPRDKTVLYRGSDLHVDYLTIPGASILELMTVFRQEYGGVTQPLDVVLVRAIGIAILLRLLMLILGRGFE